jgi:hypothetical protein
LASLESNAAPNGVGIDVGVGSVVAHPMPELAQKHGSALMVSALGVGDLNAR